MKKKCILMSLVALTLFYSLVPSFVIAQEYPTMYRQELKTEIIKVQVDNTTVDVIHTEYIDVPSNMIHSNNEIKPTGFTPEYPVGSKRHHTFRIKNSQLLAPLTVAGAITGAGKIINKEIAKDVITKTFFSSIPTTLAKFIPYFALAGLVSAAIGGINDFLSNEGFELNITETYESTTSHKEGYTIYDWSVRLSDIHVGTF